MVTTSRTTGSRAAAHPPRRPAIDVARVLALFVVVLGHLLLAVIDRDRGALRGANLLALRPGWAWITVLAPMPVFFAAAGWANATATLSTSVPRLRRLVGLAAVVVAVWSAAVVAMVTVAGGAGTVGDGARIATQPLWFLAAYVPLAVAGRRIAGLAARRFVVTAAAALAALAALDVARFAGGAPRGIGWPGFFLAWGLPWLAGAWWHARVSAGGFHERRAGAMLAAGSAAACLLLVHLGGYSPALIDAVPGARSNTTPPTLYTAAAGLAQVGVLMLAAGWLDRLGRRWPRPWSQAGEAAVAVYAWHLTALALCAAMIAAGLPVPRRLSGVWWATRPLWWAAVLAVTSLLVLATRWAQARSARPRRPVAVAAAAAGWRGPAAVVATAAGAALVGIEGPRSVVLAVACTALLVAAWRLLGGGEPATAGRGGPRRRQ